MIISPYRTSVTMAHQDDNKRVAPSTWNQKPYRSRSLKSKARDEAEKNKYGYFVATTQKLYHPAPNQKKA